MKVLAQIVNGDEGQKNKAFGEGLYLGGERYVLARADEGSLYARQVRLGFSIH
jgi:profilin